MTSFGKFFNKIKPGMCRISTNGVAINVNGEYKTYDVDSGILMNCDDFVFDVGDDMFFAIPCNNIVRGDIILVNGSPACVIAVKDNEIKAFDYKTGTIVSIVPERHIFFGSSYFYSKIFSPLANMVKGPDPVEKILPLMIFNEMCNNDANTGAGTGMGKTIGMAMMMNGGFNFSNMFGGMFGETNMNTNIANNEENKEDK